MMKYPDGEVTEKAHPARAGEGMKVIAKAKIIPAINILPLLGIAFFIVVLLVIASPERSRRAWQSVFISACFAKFTLSKANVLAMTIFTTIPHQLLYYFIQY